MIRKMPDGDFADLASFFAYPPAFTGGVFVACGDVDGDGVPEVIIGIFDGTGAPLGAGFFAY